MNQVLEKVANDTVEVLVKLHMEAKQNKDTIEESVLIGQRICMILNRLEHDFSLDFMIYVFCKTQDKLGESLSPINVPLLKKLLDNGFKVNELKVVVSGGK